MNYAWVVRWGWEIENNLDLKPLNPLVNHNTTLKEVGLRDDMCVTELAFCLENAANDLGMDFQQYDLNIDMKLTDVFFEVERKTTIQK